MTRLAVCCHQTRLSVVAARIFFGGLTWLRALSLPVRRDWGIPFLMQRFARIALATFLVRGCAFLQESRCNPAARYHSTGELIVLETTSICSGRHGSRPSPHSWAPLHFALRACLSCRSDPFWNHPVLYSWMRALLC